MTKTKLAYEKSRAVYTVCACNHHRWKTAVKRLGVRCVVECRACGFLKFLTTPHGWMAGPARRLP